MTMNEKTGVVFSIAEDNVPVAGCTISKSVCTEPNAVSYFSLAEETDISAEIYPYNKILIVASGCAEVYGWDIESVRLHEGDGLITQTDTPVGIRTDEGTVYTEIALRKEDIMNKAVKAGEVFDLKDLVPYQDGKIVNMDVAHNEKMKFVVMSFDEGTGLDEHAAPGDALIFALDGKAVIGYEGKEYPIEAGQNFHFAKGGMHSVKADGKFKMALLLTLE